MKEITVLRPEKMFVEDFVQNVRMEDIPTALEFKGCLPIEESTFVSIRKIHHLMYRHGGRVHLGEPSLEEEEYFVIADDKLNNWFMNLNSQVSTLRDKIYKLEGQKRRVFNDMSIYKSIVEDYENMSIWGFIKYKWENRKRGK